MNMNGHWNILAVVAIRVLVEEAVTATLALAVQLLAATTIALPSATTTLALGQHFIKCSTEC